MKHSVRHPSNFPVELVTLGSALAFLLFLTGKGAAQQSAAPDEIPAADTAGEVAQAEGTPESAANTAGPGAGTGEGTGAGEGTGTGHGTGIGEGTEAGEETGPGSDPAGVGDPEGPAIECAEQEPQAFLIRSNYLPTRDMTAEEREERTQVHERAIRYRTEQYGYFEGYGESSWSSTTPADNAEVTTFMGHEVRVNRRIIPALRCVEAEIQRSCAHVPYQPHRVTGLRTRNTYHTGEISNHVYGIAIDIDSDLNTCCHCVARWRDHPLCRVEVDSIFERMAMPECWVHAFERYGFYWLGWDQLEDTMHFEFLGDPYAILPARQDPAVH